MAQSSVYEDKYVLFLDILGFEAYTESDEKSEQFAKKVLGVFDEALKVIENLIPQGLKGIVSYGVEIAQFSDTFVVSCNEFRIMLVIVEYLYTQLFVHGLLCRGAITYGKVFHKGSQFIGSAINRAYNLEKTAAIYPRIIIDDEKIDDDSMNEGKKFGEKIGKHFGTIVKDSDGWYYVTIDVTHINHAFEQMWKEAKGGENWYKVRSKYMWLKDKYFEK